MDLVKVKGTLKLTNPGRPLFYNTLRGCPPLFAVALVRSSRTVLLRKEGELLTWILR